MAADLTIQLDDLTKSLGQMIESVNELSVSTGAESSDKEDPLTQIAEVLNEHLASLNWIDEAVGETEGKMRQISPRIAAATTSHGPGRRGPGPRTQ